MKKLVFFILSGIILYVLFINQDNSQASSELDYQVIPDEAIRLRILANSDDESDQHIKRLIRDKVSEQISDWVEHLTDINEARTLIESRIPEIKKTVATVLHENNVAHEFNVDYGKNITFPAKLYDTFLYPAGEYEAVLITIGEGQGANWWCVLFPPLCFLDFGNGAFVAEGTEPVELEANQEKQEKEKPVKIKFFLFEWFGWT